MHLQVYQLSLFSYKAFQIESTGQVVAYRKKDDVTQKTELLVNIFV